jgi:uncharacterized membrane protein (DUF485 family)
MSRVIWTKHCVSAFNKEHFMAMKKPVPPKIDEKMFQKLVVRKWKVSLVLTAVMLIVYFGFILVLAFGREILSTKIGEHMTLGIPVGILIIVLACVLTGIYVFWANSRYDKSIEEILKTMPRR